MFRFQERIMCSHSNNARMTIVIFTNRKTAKTCYSAFYSLWIFFFFDKRDFCDDNQRRRCCAPCYTQPKYNGINVKY